MTLLRALCEVSARRQWGSPTMDLRRRGRRKSAARHPIPCWSGKTPVRQGTLLVRWCPSYSSGCSGSCKGSSGLQTAQSYSHWRRTGNLKIQALTLEFFFVHCIHFRRHSPSQEDAGNSVFAYPTPQRKRHPTKKSSLPPAIDSPASPSPSSLSRLHPSTDLRNTGTTLAWGTRGKCILRKVRVESFFFQLLTGQNSCKRRVVLLSVSPALFVHVLECELPFEKGWSRVSFPIPLTLKPSLL